ncbi:MAG: tetratricopeptide repeat protein [Terriglobales bacterium]
MHCPRRTLASLSLIVLGLALAGRAHAEARATIPALRQSADLLEWGRMKEARALVARLVAADPKNPVLLAYYSHVLNNFGETDKAIATAKQAVALDDHCATCHLFLSEGLGAHAEQQSKLRALFELHTIRTEMERAVELAPNLPETHWGLMQLNLTVPGALGGKISEAWRQADIIAGLDPVNGWLARAAINTALLKSDEALEDYRKAAQLFPHDPRGNFAYGQALFQAQRFREAEPVLARAAELEKASPLYNGYYAATLVRLGQEAKARQVLARAMKEHPNSRLPEFLVAQALQASGHATGQNAEWARNLVRLYLEVPPEPDQPTAVEARKLLTQLG